MKRLLMFTTKLLKTNVLIQTQSRPFCLKWELHFSEAFIVKHFKTTLFIELGMMESTLSNLLLHYLLDYLLSISTIC